MCGAASPQSWLEPLEQRLLYTQTPSAPMITEFLTQNNGGLVDNHGNTPDWIEIHNPTLANIDLGGYYLTDNAEDLTRWQFPAGAVLTGGGYMTVFASGNSETTAGQPLHTSFQLGSSAGYLGLIAPDGTTVLSDYNYPDQLENVSYGISITSNSSQVVNSSGSLVKTLVPTANIGGGWKGIGFDDSNWTSGTTGVGYETDPPTPPFAGYNVRMVDVNGGTDGQLNNITEATNLLDGKFSAAAYTVVSDNTSLYSNVNFGGGGGFFNDNLLPNGETDLAALGRTDYAMRVMADVVIPVGVWTIDVASDEGFRLRILGGKFSPNKTGQDLNGLPAQSQKDIEETLTVANSRTFAHTSGTLTVTGQPLVTTMVIDYFERTGPDGLELSAAAGNKTFNTTDFVLLNNGWNGWQVSTKALPGGNYNGLINSDLKDSMYNGNTTAYMRMSFSVDDPTQWDTLKLRMKYDDGFVAYLNGVKIADRNSPSTPVWNSAATAERADEDALNFEDFDLPIPAGVLQQGQNILAIQGLNDSPDSPDFLIAPSLSLVQTIVLPGDRYMSIPTPGALNNNTNVNGRVGNTHWSHDRGFYDTAFNLVITSDTLGAQIRYTLNGSAPTPNSTLYTGPITINKTTTIRSAAFKTGLDPSLSETQTYIFLNDVLVQSPQGQAPLVGGTQWPTGPVNGQVLDYGMDPDIVNNPAYSSTLKNDLKSIPTMSLTMDINDLFNPSTSSAVGGIWVNPRGDGRAWERPGSLELIYPDGRDGFQINAGVRVRGGFSRDPNNPKHGFRFFFRDDYGAPKLKFPLFDNDPTGTDTFDKIDLRTFQNYSWSYQADPNGTFVRDIIGRDLQLAAGDLSSHGQDYFLYINGQYWGIYQTDERPEATMAESYYGEKPGGYDTVKVESAVGQYDIEATDGDLNAWTDLWNRLTKVSNKQIDIFTVQNPESGDIYTLTVTGPSGATASISYASTTTSAPAVASTLAGLWNASSNALIGGISAQAVGDTVQMTGKAIGMPFTVSSSASNGGAADTQAFVRRTTMTPVAVEVGDTFIITAQSADGLTNASVTYTATAANSANVTAGLTAAWNASTNPLISGITAIDTGSQVVLVADNSGVPFYLVGSATNGTGANNQALVQAAANIGTPVYNSYQRVQGNNADGTRNPNLPNLLDIDNLIDYLLLTYYSGNLDAPISNFLGNGQPNNFFCTRPKDGSFGFRCIEHDSEHTFLPWYTTSTGSTGNRLGPSAGTGWPAGQALQESNPQWFFQQMWNVPEFQLRVADKVRSMFFDGGLLTPSVLEVMLNKRKAEIDRAVVGESARWGDAKPPYTNSPLTRSTWLAAFDYMMNGFVKASPLTRTQIVFNQLLSFNLYPKYPTNPNAPFNAPVYSQYGGNIDNGFALTITNPNAVGGTIYYTLDGSDPRRYGGEVAAGALTYTGPVSLNSSVTVNSRIRYQTGNQVFWSALSSYKFKYNLSALHVTEVMYNPPPPPEGSPYLPDDFEFVEFQNTGALPLPLGGIHFTDGIVFAFPTMTLAPGARTLVVKNQAAFESRYGLGLPIAGEYIENMPTSGGNLSNGGEVLSIAGPLNEPLLSFEYKDGWYPITDGGGYSLVVRNPGASQVPSGGSTVQPLSDSLSWRPSNLSGGAPNAADPGINPESIVINEAMSNSTAATGDWIELRNLTASPINIGGWFLSNDGANLKKYQIPAGTMVGVGANAYVTFFSSTSFGDAANPGVNTPFDLDQVNGTAIYLTNSDGAGNVAGYRDFADFGLAATGSATYGSAPDVSFGRYVTNALGTDFTQMITPTPGAGNSAPAVGPVVISEINYNPTAGGSEFIELQNILDTPVQLWDPAFPNNTWKILNGVGFTFPTNITIPSFGVVVLIPNTISISSFRSQYMTAPGLDQVQVFQYGGATPDSRTLNNDGEDLKLGRPMTPVTLPGGQVVVPYALVDKVKYGDSLPWSTAPDGNGPSLARVQAVSYGNDPTNWKAGAFNGNPGLVLPPQRPPVVNAGADKPVIQGVALVQSGSFTDINPDQTYTGSVNWGDGNTQALTLTGKNFTLNHTYLSVGTFTVTVTITDSFPESSTDTLQVTVTPSTAPVVNAGPDGNIAQGDTFTGSGGFEDPDSGQSWNGTVNWGDGTPTSSLTLQGNKQFALNHIFNNPGDYTVTVTVKDNVNVSGTDTLVVHVAPNSVPVVNAGVDGTISQGGTFSSSGSFTDPNAQQNWAATVNWGDGSATAPLTLNANKTFSLSHAYNNPGTFTATITVTDNIGGSGQDTVVISVRPNPRTGTNGPDTYTLRLDPANPSMLQFFENRTIAQGPSYVLAYSAASSYTFSGAGGDDTLIIDTTYGNPIPSGGVNFNGGVQGANGDLLQIIGGSANDSLIIRSTQVQMGSLNINYGEAENIRFDGNGGDDTLSINNFISFSPIFNGGPGNNTLMLNVGEYDWIADAAASTPNLNLVANNSGTYIFSASQHLGSLALNGTSSAFVLEGSSAVIVTNALSVAAGAILDLANNDLVVQATAANRQAMLASINGLLRSGRNGGTWDGPGIDSSTATADANHITGLAAILNDKGDGTPVRTTVRGQPVDVNSIVLKYTYNGDANQDGVLNADDFALIDAGFITHSTGYYNGDFDYSGGPPDADDYFAIDKAFSSQGNALGASNVIGTVQSAPQAAAVSEVATVSDGASKAAAKAPLASPPTARKKHHRHHKRDVIEQIGEVDQRMFRRRD